MVLLCKFSHLESFAYTIHDKTDCYLINFSYSNHVFSDRKLAPLTPSHQFDDQGVMRAYDEQRYQDSLLLPNLLRNNLPESKIFDEKHENAFYFPGVGFSYRIILSIRREKKQVAVLVESAHRISKFPNLKHQASMNFRVAVKRIYNNHGPLFK